MTENITAEMITTVGTALILATVTTVVGFMTNITNPLPLAVLGVAVMLTVGAGVAMTGLTTEFSETDFFPSDSRALQTIDVV